MPSMLGVDTPSTSKYERIAMIIATSHAGTTVFRWNPMPNWRKLPSSLYMNRGLKACTAVNTAKNTRMENVVMCCLMKNCHAIGLLWIAMDCYGLLWIAMVMLYNYLYNIMQIIWFYHGYYFFKLDNGCHTSSLTSSLSLY